MIAGRGRRRDRELGRRARVGGKASELETARAGGLPVPPFLAVDVSEVAALMGGGSAATAVRTRIMRALPGPGTDRYAVRSSAQAEDGQRSFAGQLRTVLDVPAEGVVAAVGEVASSADDQRVARYSEAAGVSAGNVAVVIQVMVPAQWSGVAFSRDPRTFQPEVVVEAVAGPGERLVSGELTPSRALFDRSTLECLETQLPEPVPARILGEAARLALRSEAVFGSPQDVEWVHDGERMHLVQSRRLTGFEAAEVYSDTWSAEVWPGLIKPLVFDVGDIAVNAAWGRVLTSVSGPVDVDWRRMAGLAASRVYFNESLLGSVLARAGLPENTLDSVVRGDRPQMSEGSLGRLVLSGGRLVRFLVANTRWLDLLDRELPVLRERITGAADRIPEASGPELADLAGCLLLVLEDAAHLSVLTTMSLGLRNAYARAAARILRDGRDVHAAATSRAGTAPLASLGQVAGALGDLSDAQRAEVASGDRARIRAALGPQVAEAALSQMDDLLDRWGHVAAVNTDFSSPSWREDPTLIWQLALAARPEPPTPKGPVAAATAGPTSPTGDGIRAAIVGRRLEVLRSFVDARDEVNDALAQAYDAWRALAAAAGAQLTPGVLDDAGLVFYLRLGELQAALRGSADPGLGASARARRAELQRDAEVVPPHRLWDLRLPERRRLTPGARARASANGGLVGVPASPGRVEARARVLDSPSQAARLGPGEILVVDHADIAWSPLFPVAGGIVTGVGGALCHAAVVARELRIPAVVGLADATIRLRDGDLLSLDGSDGTVSVLNHGGAGPDGTHDGGEIGAAR